MFSCEFCEIFKNRFFYRTLPVDAYQNHVLSRNSSNSQESNSDGILPFLVELHSYSLHRSFFSLRFANFFGTAIRLGNFKRLLLRHF